MYADSIENNEAWHQVYADSNKSIVQAMLQKDGDMAKKLLLYNIRTAYTLVRSDEDDEPGYGKITKELSDMKLEKKSSDELIVLMTFYQSKAGLKPAQTMSMRDTIYRKVSRGF